MPSNTNGEAQKQRRRDAWEEKLRQAELARRAEQERLELERLAKLEEEERRQQALNAQAMEAAQPYREELQFFNYWLEAKLTERVRQEEMARQQREQREQEKLNRKAAKGAGVLN